jgi:hypothetical protein
MQLEPAAPDAAGADAAGADAAGADAAPADAAGLDVEPEQAPTTSVPAAISARNRPLQPTIDVSPPRETRFANADRDTPSRRS